nr:hypothetical protein [Tanacetum cinerariifolium]
NGVALDAEQLLFLAGGQDNAFDDDYVKDNEVPVVHSIASSVPNDTFMMIYNDMCEPSAPSVSNSSRNAVVKKSLSAELATYREQVELESALVEEPMHSTQDLEEPTPQEFEKGATDDQLPWLNNLAKKADSCTLFSEQMDTHVDFSAFVMNWLKVDTLTPELSAGPTYEPMKGSSKSLVELEFFLEEVYKATTDQLV